MLRKVLDGHDELLSYMRVVSDGTVWLHIYSAYIRKSLMPKKKLKTVRQCTESRRRCFGRKQQILIDSLFFSAVQIHFAFPRALMEELMLYGAFSPGTASNFCAALYI